MQPLSYQILPYSCWVTSMLNGLLILHGNKNRISGLEYRLLHAVLTDDGVHTHGNHGSDISTVLEAIQFRSGLKVHHYNNLAVADAIRNLNFKNQVAVCDVDTGQHSILLTGRTNGWIEAFDPDWDGVKCKLEIPDAFITQPEGRQGRINVLIHEHYLIRSRGSRQGGYHMGAISSRALTVMEKP